MNKNLLKVENLTMKFGGLTAIDDLSFSANSNEITSIIGPNGAGKTTTMKIVTCFMPPTSGTVEVDDLNIADNSLEIRKRIGYLPEHNPLYLDMYVHEYLQFVGKKV